MGRGRGTGSALKAPDQQVDSLRTRKDSKAKDKKREISSLIPMGHKYMKNGFNMLLIGQHGTGKTESVIQIAKDNGLKIKVFNCATLDPYTDLIGVPVPEKNEDGVSELKMVRPNILETVDVIFFDEINRAPLATRNAVFEIIQFRSINGDELPNLRCCWAAMNPVDDKAGYEVEDIDPALIDRFDAYHNFAPTISIPYMTQHMKKGTAQALQEWWNGHKAEKRGPGSYISPRRLTKLGILFESMGTRAVKQAMPPGGKHDTGKLIKLLQASEDGKLSEAAKGSRTMKSNLPINKAVKDKPAMRKNKKSVIDYLKTNPQDLETHKQITTQLAQGVGAAKLLTDFGEILEELPKKDLEGFFGGLPYQKQNKLQNLRYWNSETYNGRKVPGFKIEKYPNCKKAMARSGC